ncbi:MAG: putative phage repressor [Frankiales bacterium]|nr:putative phage repressor [Frankiales bacterium]
MLPAFRHGDWLLVLYGARRLRPGDVVVIRRPGLLLVKRIGAISETGEFTVLSDNLLAGTDSRHFGPVALDDIVARVLVRYWRVQRW